MISSIAWCHLCRTPERVVHVNTISTFVCLKSSSVRLFSRVASYHLPLFTSLLISLYLLPMNGIHPIWSLILTFRCFVRSDRCLMQPRRTFISVRPLGFVIEHSCLQSNTASPCFWVLATTRCFLVESNVFILLAFSCLLQVNNMTNLQHFASQWRISNETLFT